MKGKGLSIQLYDCKNDIGVEEAALLIDEIIAAIEMNKLGRASVQQGKAGMPGFSIIQMIETSHLALHTFSESNCYMFNLESCKDYDEYAVKDLLNAALQPSNVKELTYSIELPDSVLTGD